VPTGLPGIHRSRPRALPARFAGRLRALLAAAQAGAPDAELRARLGELVPDYAPVERAST
jgi:hypothetical protein